MSWIWVSWLLTHFAYVHACLHGCVHIHEYEQVCTKKPGNTLPVVSREESTLSCFVRQESLTGTWGLPSRLVWLSIETQASSYFSLASTGFTGLCHHAWLFTWVVRSSFLVRQAQNQESHHLSPFWPVLNWAVWNWTGYMIQCYF